MGEAVPTNVASGGLAAEPADYAGRAGPLAAGRLGRSLVPLLCLLVLGYALGMSLLRLSLPGLDWTPVLRGRIWS